MTEKPVLNIFRDSQTVSQRLAIDIASYLKRISRQKDRLYVAISGGNTPVTFFREFVKINPDIDWKRILFFWVDERCVAPDHPESNYGVARQELLDPLQVPESSCFRIKGEHDPFKEAERYSELILDEVSPEVAFPVFDLILLGMGADGHTASVFPDQLYLWENEKVCDVAIHPESGQRRITMTGHLINAANRIVFLVTGSQKAQIVKHIVSGDQKSEIYPASLVKPYQGKLEWYLDKEAASYLPDND